MRARIRDTEMFFDIDGASLVPDGPGMREKPAAFLVHGGPGADHSGFKTTYASLASRAQLIYFDHRGQGRSARGDPRKYTLDENVEDMEALRQFLGLGPIVSIGSSYGGMVAMAHAARYPQAVSHLVLISTAAHAGHIQRARALVLERGTAQQQAVCEELWEGRIDTVEKYKYYLEVMGPLYSRKYDAALARSRRERAILSPEALNQAVAPGGFQRRFDLRPELPLITAPTLILAGRHDWICPPEFAQEIGDLVPDSDVRIFEESAHSISADENEKCLDAIAGFLAYRTRREGY